MVTNIRPADERDCAEISTLIGRVWPGKAPGAGHVRKIMKREEHDLLVAVKDDGVVGFVSGFTTSSVEGTCRWELDLLAVLPEYRGQGIAKSLIRACEEVARKAGARIIRTVVRVDNHAMMAACRQCKLEQLTGAMRLMVCSLKPEASVDRDRVNSSYLVPVHTLIYSGLWLEGDISATQLAVTNAQRDEMELDVAGVLISTHHQPLLDAARTASYEAVADYYIWIQEF